MELENYFDSFNKIVIIYKSDFSEKKYVNDF
jgi:hypothetical protein